MGNPDLVPIIVWVMLLGWLAALIAAVGMLVRDIVNLIHVRDTAIPGRALRKRQFDLSVQLGGAAILAVVAGVSVNLGTDWWSSGNESLSRWGGIIILGGAALAVWGSGVLAKLIVSAQLNPLSPRALRADIRESLQSGISTALIADFRRTLVEVERTSVADAFGMGLPGRNLDLVHAALVAIESAPSPRGWRAAVAPSREMRDARSRLSAAYRRTWRGHWFRRLSFVLLTAVVSTVGAGLTLAIGPSPQLLVASALAAVIAVGLSLFIRHLRTSVMVLTAQRRHMVHVLQIHECSELLAQAAALATERDPTRVQKNRLGLGRRLFQILW